MYQGSCLCGGIKYQIKGDINNIVNCHCSRCRKVQGTSHATNGIVKSDDFKLTKGESLLKKYSVTELMDKFFCSNCGSPIISKYTDNSEIVRIRLGSLEGDLDVKPEAHIFVGSKANWDKILDDLPQYEEYPE